MVWFPTPKYKDALIYTKLKEIVSEVMVRNMVDHLRKRLKEIPKFM